MFPLLLNHNTKIAIVGAGTSGLSAAVALVEHGFPNITLFEARKECGGRTRSYVDPTTGDVLDNGHHLMMGCYTATLRYLDTIGSSHYFEREPMRMYFREHGKRSALLEMPEYASPIRNLLKALTGFSLLTTREKFAAVRLGFGIIARPQRHWEPFTCAELFRELHQPSELIRKLWSPIVLAVCNAPVDRASAVLFVSFFKEAFLAGRGASDFLTPTVGLSELLIDPAIRYLKKNNVVVRTSSPVRSMEETNGTFILHTDSGSEEFRSVINSSETSDELPEHLRKEIPPITFSPIINAYFWLDRKVFTAPIHTYLGTTLQWSFTRPSNYSAQRLALTVSAGNELVARSPEEIRDIFWNDLCSTIPEIPSAKLVHYQIIKEKRATPLFTPELQRERPRTRTNVPGLYFAGDLVQNGLPATIEGAVRNGYAAAKTLMEDKR